MLVKVFKRANDYAWNDFLYVHICESADFKLQIIIRRKDR